jgi:hypothetical protein
MAGAHPDDSGNGVDNQKPLMAAAENCNVKAVKWLLMLGASPRHTGQLRGKCLWKPFKDSPVTTRELSVSALGYALKCEDLIKRKKITEQLITAGAPDACLLEEGGGLLPEGISTNQNQKK